MTGWAAVLLLTCLMGAKESSILGQLERLDQQLGHAEGALRRDEAARHKLQTELASLDAAQAAARREERRVFAQYRTRLRALQRLGAGARWLVVGGSSSLADYLETSRLLRRVTQGDRQLQLRMQGEQQRLQDLSDAVQSRRRALDDAIADSRTRRDTLAADRRARADLLASVRAERAKAAALADERRAAQEKLRRMVAQLRPQAGPPTPKRRPAPVRGTGMRGGVDLARLETRGVGERFVQNRGRLPWPALGPLRVAFGQRVELAFGTVTSHNGWDIGATSGTRVQAVAPGQVVYAGWLRGYGQMVIVDHGEGYHSVTAHLASIDVQVNDSVDAGQLLGTVGDTGSLRGTVLYFEIRHKGTPQDPRAWLKR